MLIGQLLTYRQICKEGLPGLRGAITNGPSLSLGIGQAKADRYGDDLLDLLASA